MNFNKAAMERYKWKRQPEFASHCLLFLVKQVNQNVEDCGDFMYSGIVHLG